MSNTKRELERLGRITDISESLLDMENRRFESECRELLTKAHDEIMAEIVYQNKCEIGTAILEKELAALVRAVNV